MLGEGALTAVFIPVLSEELEQEGVQGTFRLTNSVLSWLAVISAVLVGVVCTGLYGGWLWITRFAGPEAIASAQAEQWQLGCLLGIAMMPYMFFICLSAVFAATLNVLGHFAVPALSPVLLNLAMIGAILIAGMGLGCPPVQLAYFLSLGVLFGGLLQLLAPMWALFRMGWRPQFDLNPNQRLQQIFGLFLPGLLGATVAQINILISRFLAFQLNQSAVAALFYANRLVELPLGIFALAITTVFFPGLSKRIAAGDYAAAQRGYTQGLQLIFAITIPAMVGLIVLSKPIIKLLFEWKSFGYEEVQATSSLLMIYAAAMPFYAWATYTSRGFHALQEMRTPVRIAWIVLATNLLAALLLMPWLETAGLALANLIASIVQSLLLHWLLKAKTEHWSTAGAGKNLRAVILAAAFMGVLTYVGYDYLAGAMATTNKRVQLIAVSSTIFVAAGIYASCLRLLKFRVELGEVE